MTITKIIYHLRKFCVVKNKVSSQLPHLEKRTLSQNLRLLSDQTGKQQSFLVESKIQDILRKSFPLAEYIEVRDVSGGCGAMFEISVIAEDFKGLTVVKQHRLVNEALKEEIKDMHGLRIHTALPSKSG